MKKLLSGRAGLCRKGFSWLACGLFVLSGLCLTACGGDTVPDKDSSQTAVSTDSRDHTATQDEQIAVSTDASMTGGSHTDDQTEPDGEAVGTDADGRTTAGNGILVTKKTTGTTARESSKTTKKAESKTNKERIMALFTPEMKGKTISIFTHFKAGEQEKMKFDYLEKEKGIRVKYINTSLDNYGTRLAAMINAGTSPDVAYMTQNYYPSLVTKGFVQDLSACHMDLNSPIFDQRCMENFRWNGKQYGLVVRDSRDASFQVTFYNKSLFARKGIKDPGTLWKQGNWNWDTFLECAKAINNPEEGVWGCELYYAQKFMPSVGVGLVTVGDGTITNNITDPRIVSAWTYINELHHIHKVTTALVGAEQNFAQGKSAMMQGESWMWCDTFPIATTMKDDWGVVPIPCPKGNKPVAVMCVRAACTPIGAKHPEAGMALFTYFTSTDTEFPLSTEKDPPNYHRYELEQLFLDMWDMEPVVDVAEGIYEYGGDYNGEQFSFDVFNSGMSGIQSTIQRWKTVIDTNIHRIMTEFS